MQRTIGALAAALALAVPGVADARTKFRTIKSSGTILGHFAQPATEQGYAFAGFVSDAKLGEGAFTSQGTVAIPSAGTFIAYFDHGTIRASSSLTPTPGPSGTLTYAGTSKIRGGTGRYKGARGSGRITGSSDAEGYTRFEYTQTLKVPR